ncbi:MAG: methylmalonyl Co-A mutase-associated GTPase MeaB [Verrucomicrobiota bacterium]
MNPPSDRPDWVPPDAGPGFTTRIMSGQPTPPVDPTAPRRRPPPDVDTLAAGVLARDPALLGRAITLVESNAPVHQALAQQLLARLLPHTGRARRLGFTGIPGAGKSTFIEAFGDHLCEQGRRVAVLAVDPSSSVHGGSILADKVRMEKLGRRENAFIRPSPSAGSLGGVTRKTREAILVCEAAGYDTIIVETVGVGQNEVAVRSMVDLFMVIMIAGAGDEMQGIKKGVVELGDLFVVNKADGENLPRCRLAQAELKRVLHFLQPATTGWETPVLTASARTGDGVPEVAAKIDAFMANVTASGILQKRRRKQSVEWMHALIAEGLRTRFYESPEVQARLESTEHAVADGRLPVVAAAQALLDATK